MTWRSLLRRAQPIVPGVDDATWILAYHLVGADTGSVVDISVDEFRRHLDFLEADGWEVVPLSAAQGRGGSRRRVVLTFDDAFANFHGVVLPILAERGLTATLFVPTGFVNGTHDSPLTGASLGACSWEQLGEILDAGIEIGSHTRSHANLRPCPAHGIRAELVQSKVELEQRLGVAVTSFCYPQAKWSRRVREATRAVYEQGVVGGGRPVRAADDPLSLPRLPIRSDSPSLGTMLTRCFWLEEALVAPVRQFRS